MGCDAAVIVSGFIDPGSGSLALMDDFAVKYSGASWTPGSFGNIGRMPEYWSAFKHMITPDMRRDREVQAQSALNARTVIYGRTRVGNQLAYACTSGTKNEYLDAICIFAGHEIDGYDEIWFDDKCVARSSVTTTTTTASVERFRYVNLVDGEGNLILNDGGETVQIPETYYEDVETVTSIPAWDILAPFTDFVTITYYDGSQTAADVTLIAASNGVWTANHKLLGVAYCRVRLKYSETLFPSGIPAIKAVIRGKKVEDPRTGIVAFSSNNALCIRDYLLTSIELGGCGADSDEVNEASFLAAANICDEVVYSGLELNEEPRYTLNGIIKLDGPPTQFIRDMLTSCAGDAVFSAGEWKLYVGTTASSVATIDESWLNGGISFKGGANKSDKVNIAKGSFTNSNDYWADTEFPILPLGVSSPPNSEYWAVVVSPTQYVAANTYNTGSYVSLAGKIYKAYNDVPVATPPPDASYWLIVDPYDSSLAYAQSSIVQNLGVVYIALVYVPISNAYLAEDGGEVLTANLVLPFTITSSEAQRLAKIALEKSRRGFSLSYPCNHKAFELDVMDVVTVTNDLMGINGLFRIVDWSFSFMGGTSLSLVQYDPNIYNWIPGDSTPLEAPDLTNLPDPLFVSPPSAIVLTPIVYDSNGGTASRVDLLVSWTAGGPGELNYELQYALINTDWTDIILVGSGTSYTIQSLATGYYNVRVRGVNSLGAASVWVDAVTIFIPNPDTLVPDITGFELFGQGNNTEFLGRDVVLKWNKPTPRSSDVVTDVAAPEVYQGWLKYYELKVMTSTGVVLRTEYLTVEGYTYTFENNYIDNAGSPKRSLNFELRAVATWGDVSANAAKLSVSNPSPSALTGIVTERIIGAFSISFDPLTELDVAGYLIHASQTTGFTPGETTLINRGPETSFYYTLLAVGDWFVKVAAYDSFGEDGLNWSDQVTVSVLPTIDIMLADLTGQLTESQLYGDLTARIDLIDTSGTGLVDLLAATNASLASVASQVSGLLSTDFDTAVAYDVDDLVRYTGNLYRCILATTPPSELPTNTTYWELIGAYASLADGVAAQAVAIEDLDTRVTTAEGTIISQSSDIVALINTVDDPSTGVSALSSAVTILESDVSSVQGTVSSHTSSISSLTSSVNSNNAAIVSEASTRANADSAIAGSLTTLQSTVGSHTTSIATQTTSINGILGKYSVKIDNNGYVSGFGLISTNNNAAPTSEFIIVADKFSIAPVATSPTANDNSPFFYLTTPTVVNGVTLSAGMYIKRAYIGEATVDTLQIAGNAVTIPVSAYSSGSVVVGTVGVTTLQSAVITVNGTTPVSIMVSCGTQNNANQSMIMRISRDSTVLRDLVAGPNSVYNNTSSFSFHVSDTPSAGTHTYYFSAYIADGSANGGAFSRGLTLIGSKR